MGAKETTRYLGGEVELTGKFFPDVEGEMRMERITRMDLSFSVNGNCHTVMVDVREKSGVFYGEILAGKKELEALFDMQEVQS